MTALGRLVDRARATHGNLQAIADAAGVSLSALVRATKAPHVLSTEKLLALAEAIGERPDVVLKAAGKSDVAARLTRLYGTPAKPLSAVDRALLELPAGKKRAVASLFSS